MARDFDILSVSGINFCLCFENYQQRENTYKYL